MWLVKITKIFTIDQDTEVVLPSVKSSPLIMKGGEDQDLLIGRKKKMSFGDPRKVSTKDLEQEAALDLQNKRIQLGQLPTKAPISQRRRRKVHLSFKNFNIFR